MTETLIAKKKNKGLGVQVKDIKGKRHSEASYNTTVDLKNYKALAGFLEDMKILYSAPVEKAFREMQRKKSPLW